MDASSRFVITIASALYLIVRSISHASEPPVILNGSFELDHFGAPFTGWEGGSQMGYPIGAPMSPPLYKFPPPPVGVDGNVSAGVFAGSVLRQTVSGNVGQTYEFVFHAKAMSGMPAVGQLRVRILAANGAILSEMNPSLLVGGAGSEGFQRYSIVSPELIDSQAVTLEFANIQTIASNVGIDAVSVNVVLPNHPPTLDFPISLASSWKVSWTETALVSQLQKAHSPTGP